MTAITSARPSSGKLRALIAFAAVAMLVYLCVAVATDGPRVELAFHQLGWSGVGLILLLSFFNYAMRFQRWHLYLRALDHELPWARHFLVYLGGFMLTVSPAKAGEAVRGVYLREQGVSYSDTFAALFVERLLDFSAYALLATLIAYEVPSYRPVLAGAFVVALVLLYIAGRPGLPAFIDHLAAGRSSRIIATLAWGADLLRASRRLLSSRLLLPGLVLGVMSWGAEGIGFWLLCNGMGIEISQMTAIGIYAIAGLAGAAAFFMPGGIGGMEAVMTLLLTLKGAPPQVAFVATLMCRLATLWFAVVVGFICTAVLEFQNWRPAART